MLSPQFLRHDTSFRETPPSSLRWQGRLFGCSLLMVILGGCSNPISKLMFTDHKHRNPAMTREKQNDRMEEQVHRASYRSTKSSADLEWLMQNRIENGLTIDSVNNIIGQKGKLISSNDEIEQTGGMSSSGTKDGVYEYGPDDRGQVYQLTIKNSRVVDFTPTAVSHAQSGIAQMSHARSDEGGIGKSSKSAKLDKENPIP